MSDSELNALHERISRNHEDTIQRLTRLETALGDLPHRVRKLEKHRDRAVGVFSAVSAIIGAVVALLLRKVGFAQ